MEVLGRIIRGKSNEVLVWLSVWSKVRQLYDLHIYSMTYTLFFYSRLSVSKMHFYVFLDNIFLLFLWRPIGCGGPWATAQFVPSPLNQALVFDV